MSAHPDTFIRTTIAAVINPEQSFQAAIAASGLTPPDTIEPDGLLHRFSSDGRRGNDAGWYTLHLDGIPAGAFGCWRTGLQSSWCGKAQNTMTDEEVQAYRDRVASMKRQREADTVARHDEAKTRAQAQWADGVSCTEHPYLTSKGIGPHGVKVTDTNALLVPMRQGGELCSLQTIQPDGQKRFMAGGRVKGCYHGIGKLVDKSGGVLVLCEGYATGASIHEATGHAVAVAFNAGNLLAVAQALRAKLPSIRLIVAADDDNHTPGNPGLTKATEAARAVGGLLAVPDFGSERPDGATDFNDLHQSAGAEAVKRCIEAATFLTASSDAGGEDDPEVWDEPLPLPTALPPVPPFNMELLPEGLRGWIADISERMQCPPEFAAVGAMVALSSLVGARVVVQPKERDDWRVTPNLWGMVIGRPGVMKSPALSEVLRPLHRLEVARREAFLSEYEQWQAMQQARKLEQGSREKDAAKKAGKVDTATLAAMLKATEAEPEPVQRRMIVNDCSVEALTELMRGNEWGLMAYRDELSGLLESMTREGQEGARAFYLSAFDGDKSHTVDRIGRGMGLVIPRMCLSMLGGIQPGKLQEIVRGAARGGGMDDGLLQRFQLAVWPDVGGAWVNVDRWPDTEHRQAANGVFDRLAELPDPQGDAPAWRFSPEAQTVFNEWRCEFEARIRDPELHDAMASHLSKYRKLVPALALLFALVDTPQAAHEGLAGVIGEVELLRSLAWSEYLERHAERIYAAATMPQTGGALALLRRIRTGAVGATFKPRDVAQKNWSQLTTVEDVRKACAVLVDYAWLRREVVAAGGKGGRPSEVFRVNPVALTAPIEDAEALV